MIDPSEDGRNHINIYSQGKTILGRLLSNFAFSPVVIGTDGKFDSLEGYWYWLLAENNVNRDLLRKASGFEAKKIGRQLLDSGWSINKKKDIEFPDDADWVFKTKFIGAMKAKVKQQPIIEYAIKNSDLPFMHYYEYSGKVVFVKKCDWMIEAWELIRKELKGEQ